MERLVSKYNPQGFVVVCAVNEESSLVVADTILHQVNKLDLREKSVILVANKADMIRSRVVHPSGFTQQETSLK